MGIARNPVRAPINAPFRVLFASLIGTTIELFDFYIYATAAVLVFPHLFFPTINPASATLASLATFGIAFLARPVGSILFGHFGDRLGRKTTLVVALAAMGLSTVAIGVLPTYDTIGIAAPVLLAVCRFGQGIGLGGEWGGAVLLAIENAPPEKRAWYGMFPQLGAPLGFFLSSAVFLVLSRSLTERQLFSFGWRLPFLSSVVLVALGLYVRLNITESPEFRSIKDSGRLVEFPVLCVYREHRRALLAGVLLCLPTFILFYLMTVFSLSWGTGALGYSRAQFLMMQLFAILFFAIAIPISAIFAKRGPWRIMLWGLALIAAFGLFMARLFVAGSTGAVLMMAVGLTLMGLTYGPLGTTVADMFPTSVRYTGSSMAFSFGAILGASLAPYATTWITRNLGLPWVGYYLSASAILALLGSLVIRRVPLRYVDH